ncbi:DUF2244 domain-containing protein [Ancylobacter dichloromethanicus]
MSAANTAPLTDGAGHDEPELFSVRYRPHRSLDQRGFMVVMFIVAGISFICGLAFLMMGGRGRCSGCSGSTSSPSGGPSGSISAPPAPARKSP